MKLATCAIPGVRGSPLGRLPLEPGAHRPLQGGGVARNFDGDVTCVYVGGVVQRFDDPTADVADRRRRRDCDVIEDSAHAPDQSHGAFGSFLLVQPPDVSSEGHAALVDDDLHALGDVALQLHRMGRILSDVGVLVRA